MTTLAWSLISGCSAFIAGTCFGMWVIARKTETVDPNWDTDYGCERMLCEQNSRKLKKWSDSTVTQNLVFPESFGPVVHYGVYRGTSHAPIATPPPRPAPPSPPHGG